MYEFIYQLFHEIELAHAENLAVLAVMILAVLLSLLLRGAVQTVLTAVIKKLGKQGEIVLQSKLIKRIADLAIPSFLIGAMRDFPQNYWLLEKLVGMIILVICLRLLNAIIYMVNDLYAQHEIAKTKPIKGILQVTQVICYVVFGVIAIAVLMDTNPAVLLGGVGAAAAVLSFVFKDPILGLVAGVQLAGNDMVRIGDWIEMPKYSADGNVVEISLTTVKVKNFNNSFTHIPVQALVNDAFINWRGMEETGGKRIKRAICIDAADVRFCDEVMLNHFQEIGLIQDYLAQKMEEIANENDGEMPKKFGVNHRNLTNLGTFRAYMEAYLRSQNGLRKDMTVMVRQLPAEGRRIPLEVYAFVSMTDGGEYEEIQSDVFDHFYSVLPVFGLSIF